MDFSDKEDPFDWSTRIMKIYLPKNDKQTQGSFYDVPPTNLLFPKTRFDMFLNSGHNFITMDSICLREVGRFNYNTWISFDLGLLLFYKNNVHLTKVIPRLNFKFKHNFYLHTSFGLDTQIFGITKEENDYSLGLNIGNDHSWLYWEIFGKKKINNYEVSAKISSANNKLKVKNHRETIQNSITLETNLVKSTLKHSINYKILKDIHIKANLDFSPSTKTINSQIGVILDLTPYTKLGYYCENCEKKNIFKLFFQHGAVKLRVPIKIENLSSLVGVLGVACLAYITKKITNYFRKDSPEVQENLRVKESEQYISMISEKVQESMQKEKESKGLVFLKALYGPKSEIESFLYLSLPNPRILDVTIAINFFVEKSACKLPSGPKWSLPGFYQTAPEPLHLYLHYQKSGVTNEIYVEDEDPFEIC